MLIWGLHAQPPFFFPVIVLARCAVHPYFLPHSFSRPDCLRTSWCGSIPNL